MDKALALGRLLRMYRDRSGLTQEEVSEELRARVGLSADTFATSPASLRRTEAGKRPGTLLEIQELCDILGVPLVQFIEEWETLSQEPPPRADEPPPKPRPVEAPASAHWQHVIQRITELASALEDEGGERPPVHVHLPGNIFRPGEE